MPTGWRIVKTARAATAFDGEGARLFGGRWNSPGTRVVYTAQSEALAALELLVHLGSHQILGAYSAIPATFDDALVTAVDPASLPADWRAYPAPPALAAIGDAWIASAASVVLRVPSVLVPDESNYLIDPAHRDVRRVKIGQGKSFRFDPRLK